MTRDNKEIKKLAGNKYIGLIVFLGLIALLFFMGFNVV